MTSMSDSRPQAMIRARAGAIRTAFLARRSSRVRNAVSSDRQPQRPAGEVGVVVGVRVPVRPCAALGELIEGVGVVLVGVLLVVAPGHAAAESMASTGDLEPSEGVEGHVRHDCSGGFTGVSMVARRATGQRAAWISAFA